MGPVLRPDTARVRDAYQTGLWETLDGPAVAPVVMVFASLLPEQRRRPPAVSRQDRRLVQG